MLELYLNENSINRIESNAFYNLLKLDILDMRNNSIDFYSIHAFNNSVIAKLILSNHLSSEIICNLTKSLQSKFVKNLLKSSYYNAIIIENRVDTFNCQTILKFLKSRILYNFLGDQDMLNFVTECNFKKLNKILC